MSTSMVIVRRAWLVALPFSNRSDQVGGKGMKKSSRRRIGVLAKGGHGVLDVVLAFEQVAATKGQGCQNQEDW